jgi:hypothetical protein
MTKSVRDTLWTYAMAARLYTLELAINRTGRVQTTQINCEDCNLAFLGIYINVVIESISFWSSFSTRFTTANTPLT